MILSAYHEYHWSEATAKQYQEQQKDGEEIEFLFTYLYY